MKTNFLLISLVTGLAMVNLSLSAFSKMSVPAIKEDIITYSSNGKQFKGFVAYDQNLTGKRPAILIVPEWWGLNDYIKMRARKLAELGYFAMAIDVYGDGRIAADPTQAQELTAPFYKDPGLGKTLLESALLKVKEYPQADSQNIAAIGYCFGGFVVLNSAKLGTDFKGVVSFHGGLTGVPVRKNLLKAKILVCQGASDKFVSMQDYNTLKRQLDSIGADNTFRVYANATHAFTNPDATKIGKEFNMPIEYNADADRDSWNDMKIFFDRVFKK